jgi:hypothetical protein
MENPAMTIRTVLACWGLLLAGLPTLAFALEDISCHMPDTVYGATYEISQQSADESPVVTETLHLLRSEHRVLHVHPQAHTTDMWERNSRGGVHYSRFFDEQQRGIEFYQAVAAEPSSELEWDQVYQMVPSAVMSPASRRAAQQQAPDCAAVETYAYQVEGDEYTLDWLPAQRLVLRLTLARGQSRMSWHLLNVSSEPESVARAIYVVIDYADLGDQESDPFFRSLHHGAQHP